MGLFRRKTLKPLSPAEGGLTRERALSLSPVKNRFVEETVTDKDFILLTYPTTVKPWFSTWAKRLGAWDGKPLMKKLELDEMGTATWRLIDGKKTVNGIAKEFAARYGLQKREAEMSVSAFIRELGRRGLLGFTDKPQK